MWFSHRRNTNERSKKTNISHELKLLTLLLNKIIHLYHHNINPKYSSYKTIDELSFLRVNDNQGKETMNYGQLSGFSSLYDLLGEPERGNLVKTKI